MQDTPFSCHLLAAPAPAQLILSSQHHDFTEKEGPRDEDPTKVTQWLKTMTLTQLVHLPGQSVS